MPKTLVKDEARPLILTPNSSQSRLKPATAIRLGNSLRRVLLSSLEGAAITSVRIDGAPHEFTSLPGIVEDVMDIILNLKKGEIQGARP